jgi:membrane-bound lytic murein transglycosylase D
MRLRSGSTLLVPKNSASDEDISADVVENAVLSVEPDLPDTHKVFVRVKRTESIAQIALRYDVSVAQIQSWNKTRKTTFKPGQQLLLHLPVNKVLPVEPPRVIQAQRADPPEVRGGIIRVSDPIPAPQAAAARAPRERGPAVASEASNLKAAKDSRRSPAAKPAELAKNSHAAPNKSVKPAGKPPERAVVAAKSADHPAAPGKAHSATVGRASPEKHSKPVTSADKGSTRQEG